MNKSGRDIFKRFKFIINAIATTIRIIPKNLLIYFWGLTDIFPKSVGLLARYCILKALIKECGDNVYVGSSVEIKGWEKLSIGNNVSIHRGCYIDANGEISIGNDVSIAHQTSILSFDHTWANYEIPIKYNPIKFAPVKINDDVWIGCGCRILSNVTISSRVIVAAGSVVTKNVCSGQLIGGVPAKLLKNINRTEESES